MFLGKFVVGYMPVCGEKEYYLACACGELYAPPSAYVALFGLTVQQTFLRGNFLYDNDMIRLLCWYGYGFYFWVNKNYYVLLQFCFKVSLVNCGNNFLLVSRGFFDAAELVSC